MQILITGASGFIGAQLMQAAGVAYGQDKVMALSSRSNSACNTIVYDGDFNVNQADLVKFEQVEVLIHAGAYTPKSGVDANAIHKCNGNIIFTGKLLDLPFKKLKKIIYLSTVDVYDVANPIIEETPTLPATLYGMSKLYSERMVSIYAATKEVSCQILRIGHVYGPGEEKYAKFLPKAIQNIVDGKPVELWGDGAELRSFIYIDDVVKAILGAVNMPAEVGVINIVGANAISIRELLNKVIAISGKSVELNVREYGGAKRDYVFDNTKLKTYLLPQETDLLIGLRLEYAYIEGLR